ncbi:MAG TPA: kelch repeat-containing protein, partial [Candidatus Latescibacteria bacterium]|nr:kelch repeat-containing protein [Candidatus Latescibacterota bacterium]
QLPAMAQARGVAGVAAVGTRILVVGGGEWEKVHGGAFTAESVTKAELLDLSDLGTGWRILDVPFSPRAGCAAAAVGPRVYVFGGYTCQVEAGKRAFTYFDDTFSFDVNTGTWQQHSSLPGALSGHCAVSWGDRYVVLIGGVFRQETCGQMLAMNGVKLLDKRKALTGEYSDLVWVYDTVTDTFTLMEERSPHGLNDIHACVVGNTIFTVGGENVDPATSNTTDYVMLGKITGN